MGKTPIRNGNSMFRKAETAYTNTALKTCQAISLACRCLQVVFVRLFQIVLASWANKLDVSWQDSQCNGPLAEYLVALWARWLLFPYLQSNTDFKLFFYSVVCNYISALNVPKMCFFSPNLRLQLFSMLTFLSQSSKSIILFYFTEGKYDQNIRRTFEE